MVIPVRSMNLHHFYGWDGDFTLKFYCLNTEISITKLTPSDWSLAISWGREERSRSLLSRTAAMTFLSGPSFFVGGSDLKVYQARRSKISPYISPSSIPHSRFGSSLTANGGGHADIPEIFCSQILFYWNILSLKVMPDISPGPQCQNLIKQTTGMESLTILLPGWISIFI